jgi:hypothetical protein
MIPTSGRLNTPTSGASFDISDSSENCENAVATCFTAPVVAAGSAVPAATNDPFEPDPRADCDAGANTVNVDGADPPVGAGPPVADNAPVGADPSVGTAAELGENTADGAEPWSTGAVCDAGDDGAPVA